jgi:hypothetical protein
MPISQSLAALTTYARDLSREHRVLGARYDAATLAQRRHARAAELVLALGAVFLGTSGATGVAAGLAAPGAGIAVLLPAVGRVAVALAVAYTQVARPREREARLADASAACATLVAVAEHITTVPLLEPEPGAQAALLANLHIGTLVTLKASFADDLPPLPEKKAA